MAINHDSSASKEESYADLQKEIDRIFFLTGIHIDSILEEIEEEDGNTTMFQLICSSPSISANVAESLSAHRITTQQWEDNNLSVQLRLWTLAQKEVTLAAKVNLLFQIIEIEHPKKESYPEYKNPEDTNAEPIDFPHPMTESRLLRNLVSHSKGEPQQIQLKRYCRRIGLDSTHDPTNPNFLSKIQERLHIPREQAKEIIDGKIYRTQTS